MTYPKIPLAQSIVQICLAKGLTNIIICPGSRNAPLTIGFASNPKFNCYSIADERSAAFFALGISQQTSRPPVLVCTSGSALLNFYPAFAEAFYSQVPLVVISADRPPHMIDIGDGQTIRQENVFHNHSLYNANLSPAASPENEFEINHAINKAFTRRGPVHINAPFEEPLYEVTRKLTVDVTISAFAKVYKTLSVDDLKAYTNIWNSASRKLILVGVAEPDTLDEEIVQQLAADPSVAVMTESTSNLHHRDFTGNIDRIITPFTPKNFLSLQPEVLVTFGGMVVSKRIKSFLRRYRPLHHWHIDPIRAYDTYGSLSRHFDAGPNDFFQQFLPFTMVVKSNYKKELQKTAEARRRRHDRFFPTAPFSDFKAIGMIMPQLRAGSMLHVGNSAAIRYVQLFDADPSVEIWCNRGTSGIDGSTSTAIGAALASQKPTTLLTGDVGFLYDSNALWNDSVPADFKIIVINNRGGGIFRILPGHQDNEIFRKFFETRHNLDAKHLAQMYGFHYLAADDEPSLNLGMKQLHETSGPAILEVFTPSNDNEKVLASYFAAL